MEKEFVPYEEALALKELGFDEPCLKHYNTLKEIGQLKEMKGTSKRKPLPVFCVLAPLYQQAFRWFRKEHGLEHKIERGSYGCHYEIQKVTPTNIEEIDCKGQLSNTGYDLAEENCLKKLIEIVKNK